MGWPDPFRFALNEIHRRLHGKPIIWVITGSCGMALQGMPTEVHDIDLQTDKRGAYAIEAAFSECMTSPVSFSGTERIRSHFGGFVLHGVKVEIMGDISKRLPDGSWEEPVNLEKVRKWVDWEGKRFPVMDLEYEAEAYRKLGRVEKADLIKRWLCGYHF
jgi:hypothetical protein